MVTISKDDFTPDLGSINGRVTHFMKMANVTNFFVSDSEVLKHVKSSQDLKKMLAKNGTMEVTSREKNEHLKSFYIASGAVKPSSTDDKIEFIPRLLRMSGFLPA